MFFFFFHYTATPQIYRYRPTLSLHDALPIWRGRKVIEVAITFRRKPPIAAVAAEEENERHRAGRRARRDGTAETIMDPSAIIAATAVLEILQGDGFEIGRAHV